MELIARKEMLVHRTNGSWWENDREGNRLRSKDFDGPFDTEIWKGDDGTVIYKRMDQPENIPEVTLPPVKTRRKRTRKHVKKEAEAAVVDNSDLSFGIPTPEVTDIADESP